MGGAQRYAEMGSQQMARLAEVSAAKPLTGSSRVIETHGPDDSPAADEGAHTHDHAAKKDDPAGDRNLGIIPPRTRARAKTPMNFWPSLLPWLKAMKAEERI